MTKIKDGDHPRACGEKPATLQGVGAHGGSPPRMRGKGPELPPAARKSRITPAHAGKSRCSLRAKSAPWDHPRACGEKPKPTL